MATVTLRPTGAGNVTEFASQYPASGEHWDKVDDVSSDGMGTYIYYMGSGSPTDLYSISPTVLGGKINSVAVTIAAYSNVVDSSAYCVLRTHDVTYYGSENTTKFTTWETFTETWTTNPNTGSQWTWSEIYTMECGVKLHPFNNFQNVFCSQVFITVDYTAETVKSNFAMGDLGVF